MHFYSSDRLCYGFASTDPHKPWALQNIPLLLQFGWLAAIIKFAYQGSVYFFSIKVQFDSGESFSFH